MTRQASVIVLLGLLGAGWTVRHPARPATPDHAFEPSLCRAGSGLEEGRDPVAIDCRTETGGSAPGGPAEEIVVTAYNLARGGQADGQARLLAAGEAMPRADVILISEADRGCARTGNRHVARDLAARLGLAYAFAVEFVELPRGGGPGGRLDAPCEHGNAILSRFPLENVAQLRHASSPSWYAAPGAGRWWGEPRLGGRVALAADVRIGERRVRVYSMHLESGPLAGVYRAAQLAEVVAHAENQPHAVLIGGDFNWHAYATDLHLGSGLEPGWDALRRRGYADAHAGVPLLRRGTHGPLIIDLIFGRGIRFEGAGICSSADCRTLSDHLPVWSRVRFPGFDRQDQRIPQEAAGTAGLTSRSLAIWAISPG